MNTKPTFGLPYARVEMDDEGRFLKICPECGERIVLIERKDFESFSGREYAEHYDRAHGGSR